eukprot:UN25838
MKELKKTLNNEDVPPNDKCTAYFDIMTQQLCVRSGLEALQLSLTSFRIYQDLLLALYCHDNDPEDVWRTRISIRRWESP